QIFHLGSNAARAAANDSLFPFLAEHRISPAGWGFGEPRNQSGYTSSRKWWLDAAGNMVRQTPGAFSALRIPVSNQRPLLGTRVAGVNPFAPDTWRDYLTKVRSFWDEHGWLDGRLAYLYALDEPGLDGMKLVAKQAAAVHSCWAGSKVLVTGN